MIGIASPNPSGMPGFNTAFGVQAGAGGGAVNARQLPSWYNIVTRVLTANDSVSLPPAAPGMQVTVANYPDAALGTTNTLTVFGNINQYGTQDTIAGATGTQGVTGVAVPANAMALFWVVTPQRGLTRTPLAGSWQYKILA